MKSVQSVKVQSQPAVWVMAEIDPRKVKRLSLPKMYASQNKLVMKGAFFKEFPYVEKINPVFGKDGYYYDRISKTYWAEHEGVGYLMKYPHWFVKDLQMANHKPLRDDEVSALAELNRLKLLTDELIALYELDLEWKAQRNYIREVRKIVTNYFSRKRKRV